MLEDRSWLYDASLAQQDIEMAWGSVLKLSSGFHVIGGLLV